MNRLKYIEGNLFFFEDGAVWAYYELISFNYAFLSVREKEKLSDDFKLLLKQCDMKDIHILQVGVNDDLLRNHFMVEKYAVGDMVEYLGQIAEAQGEALVKKYMGRGVYYKYYVGFKLVLPVLSGGFKEVCLSLFRDFKKALLGFERVFMGEYEIFEKSDLVRYQSLERVLYRKVSKRFLFSRVSYKDYMYLQERFFGMDNVVFEDYKKCLNLKEFGDFVAVRRYEKFGLEDVLVQEFPRFLKIEREEGTKFESFMVLTNIVNDLYYPGCEILYDVQLSLSFPVDVSIRCEVLENSVARRGLEKIGMEMNDLILHARKNGEFAGEDVLEAKEMANDLELDIKRSREGLCKVTYLVRLMGDSEEQLEERCLMVRDFYDTYGFKIIRPFGDMVSFLEEFVVGGLRKRRDYVQTFKFDFLSVLGFGGTVRLGDGYGIYVGQNMLSGKPVYLRPDLAAKDKKKTITNSLACLFSGATGWGKSVAANLLLYYIALIGGRVLILDPKSERGDWPLKLPQFRENINVVNLTSAEENRGLLDPFFVLEERREAENLAFEVLSYLTGISISDGERYPRLQAAVQAVGSRERRGLLLVVEELLKTGDDISKKIALHIGGFINYGFSVLLFGDGLRKGGVAFFDKSLNILQVAGLMLPDIGRSAEEYGSLERLSVAVMLVIGYLGLEFMRFDKNIFKVFAIDEAWAMLGTGQGRSLQNKFVRMGRSLNSAIYFMTQGVNDIGGADMKNNIGMRFAFHADDEEEIKRILVFFGLDEKSEALHKIVRGLGIGECLFMDVEGHIGVLKFDLVFRELLEAFDTTPGGKDVDK